MPAVSRKGDPCTGHDCYPPRASTSGSGNVYCNGIGVLRQGDSYAAHTCGDHTHAGVVSGGSATVYVNGRPLARIGDDVSCGSAVAVGSANVFAGG